MPNSLPPHRATAPLAGPEDRLEMVRLAVRGRPGLSASAVEVRRGNTSYTIDTLRELRRTEPERPLRLLLGSDAALAIQSWHEAEALLEEASFIIFSRPSVALDTGQLEKLGFPLRRTQLIRFETPAISARMVRERLAQGEPVAEFLPTEVAGYIRDHGLYRPESRMG